jgi:aspartate kinase
MQVYKFGGASIATPERLQALLPIIQAVQEPLLIVVSALGKTTNALETIVQKANNLHKDEALQLTHALEQSHWQYAQSILTEEGLSTITPSLREYFTEIEWAIDDAGKLSKDYVYDQIVCIGEILSTTIFSQYLKDKGLVITWLDARDLIRTNDTYKDPIVDWEYSQKQVQQKALPALQQGNIVVTQGFIGCTADNNATTLGREGSDYSAALFAAMLPANRVSIWKDVEGLMSADPRLFNDVEKIPHISFHEVIEMAYYGAQVIHPKTIKPLQNANIPLYVKCFLKPSFEGTLIDNSSEVIYYPPIVVLKKHQVLLQITSRDFSFITEENLRNLYDIFHNQKVKINLLQNAAISLVVSIDNNEDKIEKLVQDLEQNYKVRRNENVSLLTIRHYTPEKRKQLTEGKNIILEQKTRSTLQVIIK